MKKPPPRRLIMIRRKERNETKNETGRITRSFSAARNTVGFSFASKDGLRFGM